MMTGSKFRDRSYIVAASLIALAAILIGCGGSGGGGDKNPTATGTTATDSGGTTSGASGNRLVFSLQWPASTRALPAYANCVQMTIQRGSDSPITQILNRVNKTSYIQNVSFDSLPSGTYTVQGEAFLDNDAQGPLVATFNAQVTLNGTGEIDSPVSFVSQIDQVIIDGSPVFMQTGVTAQLTGHAIDKDGNLLFLPPGSLAWSVTSGANYVDMTPIGFLSALAPGNVKVQLLDSASGISDSVDITITGDALTTGGDTSTTTATTTDSSTTGTTGTTTDTGSNTTTGSTGSTGSSGSGSGSGGATGGTGGTGTQVATTG